MVNPGVDDYTKHQTNGKSPKNAKTRQYIENQQNPGFHI